MTIITSSERFMGVIAAPRSLSFVAALVGSLALFVMISLPLLISNPTGLTVTINENLLGSGQTEVIFQWQDPSENGHQGMVMDEFGSGSQVPDGAAFAPTLSNDELQEVGSASSSVSINGNEDMELRGLFSLGFIDNSVKNGLQMDSDGSALLNLTVVVEPFSTPPSDNFGKSKFRSCDLYHGKWIYDPTGLLYSNTCSSINQPQNCQGNGRPDEDYENWRWKPDQCDLPRFDAQKFLELRRGKTLAFIGDSVARNQMESMLCILQQASRNSQERRQPSDAMIVLQIHLHNHCSDLVLMARSQDDRVPPLCTSRGCQGPPHNPDEVFMEFLPKFDVLVLSFGHWFSRQSVYVLNGTIVGGPKRSHKKHQIDNVKAYSIAIETILTTIAMLPNYSGLTIVRSYSPDHYEGGAWHTGGSCAGMVRPATKLVRNGYAMRCIRCRLTGFEEAAKKVRNGSKLRLMDITELSGYRHDGHPGPYRSPGSHEVMKGGRKGKPPPEDCLHWCMPGPIDTWNEILFEIISREF